MVVDAGPFNIKYEAIIIQSFFFCSSSCTHAWVCDRDGAKLENGYTCNYHITQLNLSKEAEDGKNHHLANENAALYVLLLGWSVNVNYYISCVMIIVTITMTMVVSTITKP